MLTSPPVNLENDGEDDYTDPLYEKTNGVEGIEDSGGNLSTEGVREVPQIDLQDGHRQSGNEHFFGEADDNNERNHNEDDSERNSKDQIVTDDEMVPNKEATAVENIENEDQGKSHSEDQIQKKSGKTSNPRPLKEPVRIANESVSDFEAEAEAESEIEGVIDEDMEESEGESQESYSSDNENENESHCSSQSKEHVEDIVPNLEEVAQITIEDPEHLQHYSGVLSKRRDVFKNQWRERYFTLNPESGELSYYLIPRQALRRENRNSSRYYDIERIESYNEKLDPRGIIYLHGSTVRVLRDNEIRTNRQRQRQNQNKQKQRQSRFRFLISSPARDNSHFENSHKNNNSNDAPNTILTYLAASSETERATWVQKLATVCNSSPIHHDTMSESDPNEDIYQNLTSSKYRKLQTKLLHNVPSPLANKIQQMLKASLQILYQGHISKEVPSNKGHKHQSWEPFLQRDGVVAMKKTQDNAFMVKSDTILHHNMKKIFHLLWNINRKPEYESNVQTAKRIFTYNPHTFIDYFTSLPSGSTQARDYCILNHWRVLTSSPQMEMNNSKTFNTSEKTKSIIILSFSHDSPLCPENEVQFIRENLVLSVWLLEPITIRSSSTSTFPSMVKRCRVRYASSIDFIDDVPPFVFEAATEHHALLPAMIGECLDKLSLGTTNSVYSESEEGSIDDVTNGKLEEEIAGILDDSLDHFVDEEASAMDKVASKIYSKEAKMNKNIASQERHIQGSSVLVDNIPSDGNGRKVKSSKFSISQKKSSTSRSDAYISTRILRTTFLLSSSGLWLFARTFPNLYPYRGIFFICSFIMSIIAQHRGPKENPKYNENIFGSPKVNASMWESLFKSEKDSKSEAGSPLDVDSSMDSVSSFALMIPIISWYLAYTLGSAHKEIIFASTLYLTIRQEIKKRLGAPVLYSDGNAVLQNRGNTLLGTEEFTSRFTVDLKGVIRFISNKKEENREAVIISSDNEEPTLDAEIAVSHIVVKAIAITMKEMNVFNTRYANLRVLGLQGCYQRKSTDISIVTGMHRLSSGANHAVLLKNVDRLSIRDIANQLSGKHLSSPTQHENTIGLISFVDRFSNSLMMFLKLLMSTVFGEGNVELIDGSARFGSCVVLTSPNSENSDVVVEVSPSSALGVNMVVVVGGVKVMREPRGGAIRPALSMSITINCPPANVASCRRFAERVQQLVQFPEVCDQETP